MKEREYIRFSLHNASVIKKQALNYIQTTEIYVKSVMRINIQESKKWICRPEASSVAIARTAEAAARGVGELESSTSVALTTYRHVETTPDLPLKILLGP